jgi:hypothetical protein
MSPQPTNNSWGTWYTDAGDTADGWYSDVRGGDGAAGPQAFTASSAHALAGAAGGLSGRVRVTWFGRGGKSVGSLI